MKFYGKGSGNLALTERKSARESLYLIINKYEGR